MRLAPYFVIVVTLCAFSASLVQAQTPPPANNLGELRGYSPPKMFSAPPAVVIPTQPVPAPAVAPKPILKVEPPPVVQTPKVEPKRVELPKEQPTPIVPSPAPKVDALPAKVQAQAQPQPQPSIEPTLSIEQLLNHPANGVPQAPKPMTAPSNNAVPAAPVEKGLPLPGRVPAKPVAKEKPKAASPAPAKKEPVKKEAAKKPEPKAQPKKTENVKIIKPAPKPVAKQAPKPVVETKPSNKVVNDLPLPGGPAPNPHYEPFKPYKPNEPAPLQAPKETKPYKLDGKKNMPAVKPTKVEKETLEDKTPLPQIETSLPKVAPTNNEKIIDKALEDHIVNPTTKAIEKQTAPASKPMKAAAAPTIKPDLISLAYQSEAANLIADQKKIIADNILPKLKADKSARLQVLSYASASKEGQSSARRISLSRGLALRAHLLENGIEPNRIDIRALGDQTQEKPLDRIDLLFIPSK